MLRRSYILAQFTSFDWLQIWMQQSKRDKQIAEEQKRLDAAIARIERLKAYDALVIALREAYPSLVDPNKTDAKPMKRLHDAAKRMARATEK